MIVIPTSIGDVEALTWGEGEEVVLLLHASATGPRALTGLAQVLGRENRRILAPAFSGYGSTLKSNSEYADSTARNLAIAKAVLDGAGARRRIVFGHSMGGLIAMKYALDQERLGQAIDAVILYEPILHDVLDPASEHDAAALAWDRDVISALARAVQDGDAEGGVRLFVEAWNETKWHDLPAGARKQLIAGAQNLVTETAAMPGSGPGPAELAGLSTPCLLLRGDRSPAFSRLVVSRTVKAIPAAREVVLSGYGHMAPVSTPRRIAEHIADFLDMLGPT
ncbi:MAG: alpha/beta fold hydrolase [Hyphomicrobiaceae bacterium]